MLLISSMAQISINSDFDISLNISRGIIFEDEVGEYELKIVNNGVYDETFVTPYTSDTSWLINTDPAVFKVPAKTTKTFKVYLDPKTHVKPGQYGVTLNVKSSLSNKVKDYFFLMFVKPLNQLDQDYRASIALNVEFPLDIDPRETVPMSVYMRNRNAKIFENLSVDMESKLINNYYKTPFKALEEKTEKFSFSISAYETPQEDKLIVTIKDGDEIVNQVKIPFKIIPYSQLKEDKLIEESFLKSVTTIKLTNDGNIENSQVYKYPVSLFEKTFTKVKNDHFITNQGDRLINFQVSLEPQQTLTLVINTNYRIILYAVILIIIINVMYFQLRSPVITRKEALTSQNSHEGVSEFKIRLIVKNRSQKPVENVKIIESVPSLASLVNESTLGTLEPTKIIKHDKRGTIIRWDINYLEPFEERIITYKIKSKLNIVGGLTLSPTKIKYETNRGRERVAYSKKHNIKIYS